MENTTTPTPQQEPGNNPQVTGEFPPQPAPNNKWLLITLLIISLVAISTTVFFGYKYYQIDEVTAPSPTPTPIAMEEEVPDPTPDPIENWMIFNGETFKYKYPNDLYLVKSDLDSSSEIYESKNVAIKSNDCKKNSLGTLQKPCSYPLIKINVKKINSSELSSHKLLNGVKDVTRSQISLEKESEAIYGMGLSAVQKAVLKNEDDIFIIDLQTTPAKNNYFENNEWEVLNQILSTFEFTGKKTVSWRTYENSSLGFKMQYPSDVEIDKEFDDEHNRAVIFKGNDLHFEVMLRKQPDNFQLSNYYYMDNPISEKSFFKNQPANIYKMPNGYCDGPSCSEPSITTIFTNSSDIFHLSFFGDTSMNEIENKILDSFKFIAK